MKTAIPIYEAVTLTSAAAYQSRIAVTDLYSANARELFLHARVCNGAVPPVQGGRIHIHYAFSSFDLSADPASIPGICALSDTIFTCVLQGGAGAVKIFSSLPIPVTARYLYCWIDHPELSNVYGATVTLDVAVQAATDSESFLTTAALAGTRFSSGGAVNQRVVKAGAGTLYTLYGYSACATRQFIQLFDAVSLPSEGAAPIAVFGTSEEENFGLDVPVTGLPFTTGLVVCNSLLPMVKQIGAADCFFYGTFV